MGLISRVSSRTYRGTSFFKNKKNMKFNIANTATGQQKCIEIDDEHRYKHIFEKRISHEVPIDNFGGEYKQGFSMKQGVLAPERKRLLLKAGTSCYTPRRAGERKRKSVRGCIYNYDMAAISCVIVKRGEADIPGLTDDTVANKRLGPKRASKIRKLFNLDREDDVTKFVIRRDLAAN